MYLGTDSYAESLMLECPNCGTPLPRGQGKYGNKHAMHCEACVTGPDGLEEEATEQAATTQHPAVLATTTLKA